MGGFGSPPGGGIDRTKLRLAVLGVLIVSSFVALFSRLWFLQVLASDQYLTLADENRVRFVYSEPARGRILDRSGRELVRNRFTLSVTVDRQVLEPGSKRERTVLRRLSVLLDIPVSELNRNLNDEAVSPYKPVAVANDVAENDDRLISENPEDFPGVDVEKLPVRYYPQGSLAAHALGYVNEISREDLRSEHFKGARPPYVAGDIVGKSGLEYFYDRWLRGRPRIERVIVNSANEVVQSRRVRDEEAGLDLVLAVDARIQRLSQRALAAGIEAARGAGFGAPAGGVVVMDPDTGGVVAMASYPGYDPSVLADGITEKEFDALGAATPDDPDDDALLNRAIQAQRQPGSTFKVVTGGAAISLGVADAYSRLECPGAVVYPPEGGPGSVVYRNWTPAYRGYIDFPESLEQSCDTFYYELGWRMEDLWGAANGDGSERFQRYMRTAGFDHETGVDLPNEAEGRVPDLRWCKDNAQIGYCPYGWLPGYTVNMAIGQGDLIVTPMQMAVTYAAIANGGGILQPRLGHALARPDESTGEERIVRLFEPNVVARLPLDEAELGVMREGLARVMTGDDGTARGAFAGFPFDQFRIWGKTGTAELGETELNDAWFISYGGRVEPEYVIAVYVEKAGHGGESAAPIAREIWEGIFGLDDETDVTLSQDLSG